MVDESNMNLSPVKSDILHLLFKEGRSSSNYIKTYMPWAHEIVSITLDQLAKEGLVLQAKQEDLIIYYLTKEGNDIVRDSISKSGEKKKCEHCGYDTSIIAPKEANCNHIYYPERCKVCKEREEKRKPDVIVEDGRFLSCSKCGKVVGILKIPFEKEPPSFKCLGCCDKSKNPTIHIPSGEITT